MLSVNLFIIGSILCISAATSAIMRGDATGQKEVEQVIAAKKLFEAHWDPARADRRFQDFLRGFEQGIQDPTFTKELWKWVVRNQDWLDADS